VLRAAGFDDPQTGLASAPALPRFMTPPRGACTVDRITAWSQAVIDGTVIDGTVE
jgi:hypothetical protein